MDRPGNQSGDGPIFLMPPTAGAGGRQSRGLRCRASHPTFRWGGRRFIPPMAKPAKRSPLHPARAAFFAGRTIFRSTSQIACCKVEMHRLVIWFRPNDRSRQSQGSLNMNVFRAAGDAPAARRLEPPGYHAGRDSFLSGTVRIAPEKQSSRKMK